MGGFKHILPLSIMFLPCFHRSELRRSALLITSPHEKLSPRKEEPVLPFFFSQGHVFVRITPEEDNEKGILEDPPFWLEKPDKFV